MHTARSSKRPTPQPTLTWMFPSGYLRSWPLPRVPVDALAIFARWRAAARLGHKTVAAAALAELEKLAERMPPGDE